MNRPTFKFIRLSHYLAAAIIILLAALPPTTARAWSSGMLASLVLGQANFTGAAPDSTISTMNWPRGVAVDPTSGSVFVADSNNNRVLRFASLDALQNGASAVAVLGQSNFINNFAALGLTGMYLPYDVAVDAAGTLWVADALNNRVLRFDNAASLPNGAAASGILGQSSVGTRLTSSAANGMFRPAGLFVDTAGRLWVADQENNRVLRFDNAAAKVMGDPADGLLGQAGFDTGEPGIGAGGLYRPADVAVDSLGTLWVADQSNNRVLRFDTAAAKVNGAPADGVLGQPHFVISTQNNSATGMSTPVGLVADDAGRLWVADQSNSRVLRFDSAANLENGAAASGVLGQPDFLNQQQNTTQSGLNSPAGLAVDAEGNLWVADMLNNRVLLFENGATVTITHGASSPTADSSVPFLVSFSKPVTGVSAVNFSLTSTGTISGASIASVTGSGAAWTVTVNTGTGEGSLRLDLTDQTGISPDVITPLPYTSGAIYTVDKSAPAAPQISFPTPDSLILSASPTFSGSGEPNATVTVREFSATLCSAQVLPSGEWSCAPAADLPPGLHTVSITQSDPAGNISGALVLNFTVGLPVYIPFVAK